MDKKKLTAAISAVLTYIKTSEEAAAFHAGVPGSAGEVEQQVSQIMQPVNIWGISGRQTAMQSNTMMQMRMFK